jgi:hypothetical protein
MEREMTPLYPSHIGPLGLDTLVAGYIRHRNVLRVDDPDGMWDGQDPDTAAYEALEACIRNGPAGDAWIAVVELLLRAPDEDLDVYAAGPLEMLVIRRGAELVDQIEAEAARDARFQWALGCIWLYTDDLPPDVLERIVRASAGAIKPLEKA